MGKVGGYRDFCTHIGVSGGLGVHPFGGSGAVQESGEDALFDDGDAAGGGSFAVEVADTDVIGVESVIVYRQQGRGDLSADGFCRGEAAVVEDALGVVEIGEGTQEAEEGFGGEDDAVLAGFDFGVVEVGDGFLGSFFQATGNIEFFESQTHAVSPGAAGFLAFLFRFAVEVDGGGRAGFVATRTGAIEIEAIDISLCQTVVGDADDRLVGGEEVFFHVEEAIDEGGDGGLGDDRLGGCVDGGSGFRAEIRGVFGNAEVAGFQGGFQGEFEACGVGIGGAGNAHGIAIVPDSDGDAGTVGGFDLFGFAAIDLNAGFIDGGTADIVFANPEFLGDVLGLSG